MNKTKKNTEIWETTENLLDPMIANLLLVKEALGLKRDEGIQKLIKAKDQLKKDVEIYKNLQEDVKERYKRKK